jgi:hypothetical protein
MVAMLMINGFVSLSVPEVVFRDPTCASIKEA